MSRADGAAIAARLPVGPGVRAKNPQLFGDAPVPAPVAVERPVPDNQQLETRNKKPARPVEHTIRLNGVERRMQARLEERLGRGEIAAFRPLAMRLRYALDKDGHYMTYTPDFVVTEKSGRLTMLETKGKRAFNKAVSRFKACRADWPQFDFEMWQWADGTWERIL